jgi:hypothetical protein
MALKPKNCCTQAQIAFLAVLISTAIVNDLEKGGVKCLLAYLFADFTP